MLKKCLQQYTKKFYGNVTLSFPIQIRRLFVFHLVPMPFKKSIDPFLFSPATPGKNFGISNLGRCSLSVFFYLPVNKLITDKTQNI